MRVLRLRVIVGGHSRPQLAVRVELEGVWSNCSRSSSSSSFSPAPPFERPPPRASTTFAQAAARSCCVRNRRVSHAAFPACCTQRGWVFVVLRSAVCRGRDLCTRDDVISGRRRTCAACMHACTHARTIIIRAPSSSAQSREASARMARIRHTH
ncbi:hypothetical protein BC628DRAFT_596269 [Trametes gibbosa]|nr:hypothetical protein BC628DRAFT_596269 [Trametes gibbosa]